MIHHDAYITEIAASIYCSQNQIGIGYNTGDQDFFDLDVTPDTMTWTATFTDTGDGTSWVGMFDDDDNDVESPNTGSGDQTNMYAIAEGRPNGPTQRECEVTFSDQAGDAEDITLTVIQAAGPV